MASTEGGEDNGPEKSQNDTKEYRFIELENGLRVLLISDAAESGTLQSAAALCVRAGALLDPEDIPGLAHFCEHMVFMGSKRYPKPNDWDLYIKSHGGSSNARTDLDVTMFFFDVQSADFVEALDRFARFFIEPLFKPEAMKDEAEIVDREWQEAYYRDRTRLEQLVALTAKPGHPMRKFTWGNAQTLNPDNKKIDLNRRLRAFFDEFYLAQHMTLAVLARETLDEMEEYVTETFKDVRATDDPRPDLSTFGPPFDTQEFRRLYKVVPVKNVRQLQMCWALPSLQVYYRSRPASYVAYLLGHEGRGSLLSLLLQRDYALHISCGVREDQSDQEHNSCWSCFTVHAELTENGLANVQHVVTCIFQFLRLMRERGPEEWIWQELLDIERNEFDFMEPQEPMDYAHHMAVNMQKYDPNDVITAHYIQMLDYEPEEIEAIVEELRPDNFNMVLLSRSFANNCRLQESWYKTKYSVQEIPNEWRKMWQNAPRDDSLAYPEPNAYIAEDFTIKQQDDTKVALGPKLIAPLVTWKNGELWYHKPEDYNVPRAFVNFYLKSVHATTSLANKTMLDIYARILSHQLNEVGYAAEVARLGYVVQALDYGIVMRFYGFSDKLPLLFRDIVNNIERCQIDEELFGTVQKELDASYLNLSLMPVRLNRELVQSILRQDHWTTVERRHELENISLEQLEQFVASFYDGVFIEALVQGNITIKETIELLTYMVDTLRITAPVQNQIQETIITEIPTGTSVYAVRNINPSDENSVIHNYYQHSGRASLREQMLNELMLMNMDEPCFNILRTRYKLSYNPQCDRRSMFNVIGFSISATCSASKFNMAKIDELVEKFLREYNNKCQKITVKTFDNFRDTVLKIKEGEDTNLKNEVDRHWREIVKHSYNFHRQYAEERVLKSITVDEFKRWCCDHLLPSNHRRKLSVQVVGNSSRGCAETPTAVDDNLVLVPQPSSRSGSCPHVITDVEEFRESCNGFQINVFAPSSSTDDPEDTDE